MDQSSWPGYEYSYQVGQDNVTDKLGKPIKVFKASLVNLFAGVIVGTLAIIACGGCVLTVISNGGIPLGGLVCSSLLGFVFAAVGVALFVWVWRLLFLRVLVYEEGFVRISRGKVETCGWHQIKTMHTETLAPNLLRRLLQALQWEPSLSFCSVWRTDGKEIRFGNNEIGSLDRLARMIEHGTAQHADLYLYTTALWKERGRSRVLVGATSKMLGRFAEPVLEALAKAVPASTLASLEGFGEGFGCVISSPDGRRIAAHNGGLTVWDAASGRIVCHVGTPYGMKSSRKGDTNSCQSLAFTPNGYRLACACSDKTVRVFDSDSGQEFRVMEAQAIDVLALAYSPDGRLLVGSSVEPSEILKVWDAATGRELRSVRFCAAVRTMTFSPDGRFLVLADNTSVLDILDAPEWQ